MFLPFSADHSPLADGAVPPGAAGGPECPRGQQCDTILPTAAPARLRGTDWGVNRGCYRRKA